MHICRQRCKRSLAELDSTTAVTLYCSHSHIHYTVGPEGLESGVFNISFAIFRFTFWSSPLRLILFYFFLHSGFLFFAFMY